eukprot:GFUD01109261.1.p1 GENE.GFUD01109261.1~~GFUD01109261.1.p1  ORF type:complete len:712 (-),score=118.39 GFUD01109261.1:758-2893(-)
MSNPPYPMNNAPPPYLPDPNAQNPYGQQNLPYPPSPYGNQQAPMGPSAPYPPQTNLPYGMPPYSQQQQQPGYPDAYPPPGPYQNPPQNSPYPYGNNPPPMGPPDPYPSTDERGMGKGLFSGKGLLGQAMKQADKFGAGKIVGQAAGALGIGGGGQGGHGGQGSHGAQGGPGYGAGQMGNPYGGSQGFLWSLQDKHQFLEVRGNGTEIYYSGRDHQVVENDELGPIVRADRPIPRQGQFYFEVLIVNTGENKEIAVGICTRSSPLDQFPGWVPSSFGYHGDDGNIFCESQDATYLPEKPFKSGYPIGVLLDFNARTLTFSRKKKDVQTVELQDHHMHQDWYPCIGISSPGAVVCLTMPISNGAPSPVPSQQGYQPSPYRGDYPPPQQPYHHQSPVSEAPPSHGGLLSNCRGNKKALLIGINYFGQGGELRGCINDVNNIKSLVQSRGFSDDPSHMVILTDDQRDPRFQPTRENIIEGMLWLVSEAQPNDSLFFHYSGHGSQKMDQDSDEVDGSDETIVPLDYKSAGDIVDDEMNALLVQQLPRGARLTAIFDSCHSATALDLPFIYDCNGQPKQQKYSRKTAGMDLLQSGLSLKGGNMFDKLSGAKKAYSTLSALANEGKAQDITAQTRSTQADAIMFSGCKDYQTSADTNVSGYGATGAASYAFINAVRTGGNLTFAELLAKMRDTLYGKYEQKIQMSTGFPTDMNIPFVF